MKRIIGTIVGLIALVGITTGCNPEQDMQELVDKGYYCLTFEDGSGRCHHPEDKRMVGSPTDKWPADTFDWNCETNGNKICGPGHDGSS